MLFQLPRDLRERGILGMNQRNIDFIARYNPRERYKLVDDKLKTKQLAVDAGISVPELVASFSHQHEIAHFIERIGDVDGFAIKPCQGAGGRGILVITKVENGRFYRSNGHEVPLKEIQRHLSNILAGLFSLRGTQDVALIESLIRADAVFDQLSYEGVPDIRLIVFKGFPVMGMLRLSTSASEGKANLHQGAVGVGIDIATGRGLRAVQNDLPITIHPDTGYQLDQVSIPGWNRLLELASGCYEMSRLGYIGTDLVLDADRGPLLLELNARPGLAIQIANNQGLLPRLRQVEAMATNGYSVADRVAFVKRRFGTRIAS